MKIKVVDDSFQFVCPMDPFDLVVMPSYTSQPVFNEKYNVLHDTRYRLAQSEVLQRIVFNKRSKPYVVYLCGNDNMDTATRKINPDATFTPEE